MPAILALALVLRLAHLVALHGSPTFTELELDHRYYDEWASRIAEGNASTGGSYFVDPLYAYFLAANYALFGHSLLAPRLVQIGLGVATCYIAARIARRVLDTSAAASLAALWLALYLPAIYYDSALEKTTLSLFLFSWAVERCLEPTPRRLIAAGALLGLSVLTRGNLLVFVPLSGLGLAALARARTGRWDFRRAGLFVAPACAVLLVAAAHNYRAAHELVLTSANFGQNFYIGQHRGNATGTYEGPPFVRPDPRYEQADFADEAARRTGHELSPGDCSSFWTAQALAEITADPPLAALRTLKKLLLFFHQYELPDSENLELLADFSPLMRAPLLGMGVLSTLALLGAFASYRRRPRARVLLAVIGVYATSVVVFFVLGRFRALVAPLLAVFAAEGVLRALELWRGTRPTQRVIGLLGVVAVGFVLTARPHWLEDKRQSSLAIAYHNLATLLEQTHDAAGARRAHERAVAIDDAAVPASLRQLGEIYLQSGEYIRAERMMARVLELKPDSKLGRDALKRLYARMPDAPNGAQTAEPPEAAGATSPLPGPLSADELYRQSRALRKEGRFSEAIAALMQAIAIGSYDENARYLLGGLMQEHSTPEEMVSYWSKDVANDPKPQTGYYYWAIGLERSGSLGEAIQKLEKGLELDPAHELSELELCRIYEQQGKLEDALTHCKNATEILPDLRAAHEQTAKLLSRLGREAEARQSRELAAHTDPKMTHQYYYWARYLAQHGRIDAARSELARALAQNPSDTDALALKATLGASDASAAAIPDADRTRLSALLRKDAGSPFWIAVYDRDPAARALGDALTGVLREAGWIARGQSSIAFRPKPGLFLFAADPSPPAYVDSLTSALGAIGLAPTVGRDYRAYYEEKKRERPDYPGFPLAADQSYVLVVGPR